LASSIKGCGIGFNEVGKVGIMSRTHRIGCRNRRQISFDPFNRTCQGKINMRQLVLKIIVNAVEYHALQFVREEGANGCDNQDAGACIQQQYLVFKFHNRCLSKGGFSGIICPIMIGLSKHNTWSGQAGTKQVEISKGFRCQFSARTLAQKKRPVNEHRTLNAERRTSNNVFCLFKID